MKVKSKSRLKRYLKAFALLGVSASCFYVGHAFAQDSGETLGTIADRVVESFESIGTLLVAISYLAGIGFALAGVFKFKQHKDNPQQIPLGQPLALIGIAIVLIFLPSLIGPAGETLFGSGKQAGGITGTGAPQIEGWGTTK